MTITSDAFDFTTLTWLVVFAIVVAWATEALLARRQAWHVRAHRNQVPAAFADTISLTDHQRAADYTLARGQLASAESIVSMLLSIGWVVGGLALAWKAA
ncbi:MAG: hypothetical protein ACK4XK_05415, partial [Casimicrobiaceae bacterium]